jgi:hypothetical protein
MNNCFYKPAACFFISLLLLSQQINANVSLRNGNFFMGYTDIQFTVGLNLKIERVYNSKSPFLGIFGWGWGSDIETYAVVYPDGSFMVHESGGGAQNSFDPVIFDANAKTEAVNLIVDIIMKVDPKSPLELTEYRKKLMSDRDFFLDQWGDLIRDKKAKPFVVPTGTLLVSNRFGYQVVTKTAEGYTRAKASETEYYNNAGKLVKVVDKSNNYYMLTYSPEGVLQSVEDNLSNKMILYINKDGLVDSIHSPGDKNKRCYYRYNEIKELVFSADTDDNQYRYGYDAAGRHNMTGIFYDDSTSMIIEYLGRDQFENVKSVRERDRSLTTYEYINKQISETESSLTVRVNVFNEDNESIQKSEYRYELTTLPNGKEFTSGMYSELDGDISYTRYNENNSPLMVVRGEDTTFMRYNNKELMTYKKNNYSTRQFQYSPTCLKLTRLDETFNESGNKEWHVFEYDAACRLSKGKNSEGKTVSITYNATGKPASIQTEDGLLVFMYNETGKTTRLTLDGKESIDITYDAYGEVDEVKSDKGKNVTLKITSALQKALEIMRPAGVTVEF